MAASRHLIKSVDLDLSRHGRLMVDVGQQMLEDCCLREQTFAGGAHAEQRSADQRGRTGKFKRVEAMARYVKAFGDREAVGSLVWRLE